MPRHLPRAVAGLLPALLLAATAHAVRPSKEVPERTLERAGAGQARLGPRTVTVAPAAARPAFDAFRSRRGAWKAIWDADRAVPTSLWGEGIVVAGSTGDAAIAEDAARRVLADELALLAPGAAPGDFVVERNHLRAGIRSVWFRQHAGGVPVVGAQVGFSFKDDTLLVMRSTAVPHLAARAPARPVARDAAERQAAAWIEDVYGAAPAVLGTGAPQVLAMTLTDGTLDARVVLPVTVDLARPRAQWTIWVDAGSGKPVARRQQLLFGQGTLRYLVPDRYPAGGRSAHAAAFAGHMADGIPATSDVAGLFSWAGVAAATVAPGLVGTYAQVINTEGALATDSLSVSDGGDAIWDQATIEKVDAQLVSFIHATIAKRYAIDTLDPDLPWLHQSMQVVVNEPDICNAYSMLDDIHFFVLGTFEGFGTCDNTARLPDIVYHEFGHSLHGQGSGQTDFTIWSDGMFALSEGTSDYYAATITGDPAMGPGFFLDDPNPLRHIDPAGIEKVYPTDLVGESHADGEIIAGALWDLRKALIVELGESAGVALADDIYYGVIVNAPDMTGAYAEALLIDDDDADLSNGTPHQCTIQGAFDLHGLGDGASILTALEPPTVDGLTLTVDKPDVSGGGGSCPAVGIAAVTAFYRLRGEGVFQSVPFVEGTDTYTATLPIETEDQVVEYRVEVMLDGGATRGFPDHPVEPWYELFPGQVTEIYCTDFESDPGWSLGEGWVRGAPAGQADPEAAFSGVNVLGTFLGDTGMYLPDALTTARSPEIDVTGYDVVRLQYRRWLGVERAAFDTARISVDGVAMWSNDGFIDHTDREWLWRDIDITPLISDGRVRIELTLDADGTFEYGGWNVDDFCVVGVGPPPVTGDDAVDPGGDGGCCSSGDRGATGPILLALLTFAGLLRCRRGERGTGGIVR